MNDSHKNNIQEEEEIIKGLFDSFELSEPSDNFTKNIMSIVVEESKELPTEKQPYYIKLKSTIWYSAAALITAIFIVALYRAEPSSANLYGLGTVQQMFGNVAQSTSLALSKIPSIAYLIALGSGVLYYFDKLIIKVQRS